ncbi:hypothetical protein L9F63_003649, partial [Diploptera punctata]
CSCSMESVVEDKNVHRMHNELNEPAMDRLVKNNGIFGRSNLFYLCLKVGFPPNGDISVTIWRK